MIKIKLCGLMRLSDIEAANRLMPEYIGFVFERKSRRYVTPEEAAELKRHLVPGIKAVGVFVNETAEAVALLLNSGTIDMAQFHGMEDETYIRHVKKLTGKPLIQAFSLDMEGALAMAKRSPADFVLLDSGGGGTGMAFDWSLVRRFSRPFFLAGGLHAGNVAEAAERLSPYAVDVSSGIETDGKKDPEKIAEFVRTVRNRQR